MPYFTVNIIQSNPDIRMSFGDSKIKDIAGYPYIENSIK